MTRKTGTTKTKPMGRTPTKLGKHNPPFITVTTAVRKHKFVRASPLTMCVATFSIYSK